LSRAFEQTLTVDVAHDKIGRAASGALEAENFRLDFVDLKTNSASNCRREKTTKKTILRFFCRCDFSHSLGQEET
jgi:hypothetical protein